MHLEIGEYFVENVGEAG